MKWFSRTALLAATLVLLSGSADPPGILSLSGSADPPGILSVGGRVVGPDGTTPLPGNGLPITGPEGYVQCIYAGPDGLIAKPAPDGTTGGDDVLLETAEYPGQYFTAIGEGYPFNPNGRFYEDFAHNLPVGAMIYVRVWNGADPRSSTHYGESGSCQLTNESFDECDFGQWAASIRLRRNLSPVLNLLLN